MNCAKGGVKLSVSSKALGLMMVKMIAIKANYVEILRQNCSEKGYIKIY